MARATYVYLVIGARCMAPFTVKHELVRWLRRKSPADLAALAVWRCRDGLAGDAHPPSTTPMAELLALPEAQ